MQKLLQRSEGFLKCGTFVWALAQQRQLVEDFLSWSGQPEGDTLRGHLRAMVRAPTA